MPGQESPAARAGRYMAVLGVVVIFVGVVLAFLAVPGASGRNGLTPGLLEAVAFLAAGAALFGIGAMINIRSPDIPEPGTKPADDADHP